MAERCYLKPVHSPLPISQSLIFAVRRRDQAMVKGDDELEFYWLFRSPLLKTENSMAVMTPITRGRTMNMDLFLTCWHFMLFLPLTAKTHSQINRPLPFLPCSRRIRTKHKTHARDPPFPPLAILFCRCRSKAASSGFLISDKKSKSLSSFL